MSRTSKEITVSKELEIRYLNEQVNILKIVLSLAFIKMREGSDILGTEEYIMRISSLAERYGLDLLTL
ncbi:MAG: hypothetical protein K0S47_4153 [Herbinix sp.]|nr:hypothetical protein [Herbinix sp.]